MFTPYNPVFSLFDIPPREAVAHIHKKACTKCLLYHDAFYETLEKSNCPSSENG